MIQIFKIWQSKSGIFIVVCLQILPTAQRLLDELLSSQSTAINTVCGAPGTGTLIKLLIISFNLNSKIKRLESFWQYYCTFLQPHHHNITNIISRGQRRYFLHDVVPLWRKGEPVHGQSSVVVVLGRIGQDLGRTYKLSLKLKAPLCRHLVFVVLWHHLKVSLHKCDSANVTTRCLQTVCICSMCMASCVFNFCYDIYRSMANVTLHYAYIS